MGWNRFSEDHDACGVGFVAQLGKCSHDVVSRAIEALRRLEHRGGVDADGRSGDGAGLLTTLPEGFLRESAKQCGIECPEKFAVAMIFLPRDGVTSLRAGVQKAAEFCGVQVLGWREVPTNPSILGPKSYEALPVVQQCFFAASVAAELTEDRLFWLRKHVELAAPAGTYVCSLSSRTIVYKGLLTPEQLSAFYPDLADARFTSSFAVFHQRYSTNTRPSWALAQPFRCIAHNGEINTISGNRRWVRAKQAGILAKLGLGPDHELLERGVSDSASFDNALEAALRLGCSPEAAMLRMMPPAWENEQRMPADLRN